MLLEAIGQIERDQATPLTARQLERMYPSVESMLNGYIAEPDEPRCLAVGTDGQVGLVVQRCAEVGRRT